MADAGGLRAGRWRRPVECAERACGGGGGGGGGGGAQSARQLAKRGAHVDKYVVRDPGFPQQVVAGASRALRRADAAPTPRQWHLHDARMSINVQPVWDGCAPRRRRRAGRRRRSRSGVLGKGVLVTIVDDGLQVARARARARRAARWR